MSSSMSQRTKMRFLNSMFDHCIKGISREAIDWMFTHHADFCAPTRSIDSDEYPLEFTRLYQDFTSLFDSRMEEFLSKNGKSMDDILLMISEFRDCCSEFINMLNVIFDFQTFSDVMKSKDQIHYLESILESYANLPDTD